MFSAIILAGFTLLLSIALLPVARTIYVDVIAPMVGATPGATTFEIMIFSAIPLAVLVVAFAAPILMALGGHNPFSRRDE